MKIVKYIFMVLLIATGSSCEKKQPVQDKVFPVSVITLQPKRISSRISVAGTVDSKVHTWVNSTVEGTVESLRVVEGQKVSVGEIMCYIMPTDYYNMLGQASAEYERAKSEFESAPETEKERYRKLLKDAEERFISAKNLYKSTPIVSSATGTVLSKNIEVGSNVSAKQPLIEIADMSKLIVRSAVSEQYVSKIRIGQPVSVHLPDKTIDGRISVITPGIQLESRTASIEVSIPSDQTVRPGMFATLDLVLSSKDDALVIPQDAMIVKPNGDKFVFTVEDGIAKAKKIVTGIESNSEIEVVSGLKQGDKVVVLGQDNLKDGVKVKLPETSKDDKSKSEEKK